MILATACKEFVLLLRDVHALAVLFLMPLVFVVVMSLAMPDPSTDRFSPLQGAFYQPAESLYTQTLAYYLQSDASVSWQQGAGDSLTSMQAALRAGELDFVLVLPGQADGQALEQTQSVLYLAPGINPQQLAVLEAMIRGNLGKTRLFMFLRDVQGVEGHEALQDLRKEAEITTGQDKLQHEYLFRGQGYGIPSAVQQSVPAWLVFGMFFVLIPLSATMIVELQQGTLRRLLSMNVSPARFLTGKLLPYFVINQLQLLLMLGCGLFLIPALGGSQLVIHGPFAAIVAMSAVCSMAALGFAMLISVSVRSTEQATALGGAANIILAAVGGIMIPKFVMPEAMQLLANISPMSWALDGFLEVILFGGSFGDIAGYMAVLLLFAGFSFLLAVIKFKKLSGYYG